MVTYLKANCKICTYLSRYLRRAYEDSDTVLGNDTTKYLGFHLLPGPVVDSVTQRSKRKQVPGRALLEA